MTIKIRYLNIEYYEYALEMGGTVEERKENDFTVVFPETVNLTTSKDLISIKSDKGFELVLEPHEFATIEIV